MLRTCLQAPSGFGRIDAMLLRSAHAVLAFSVGSRKGADFAIKRDYEKTPGVQRRVHHSASIDMP